MALLYSLNLHILEILKTDLFQFFSLSGLLDPRWREEQKKQVEEKKTQEEVFAEGMQIGTHLKYLAERRTDIFGMEETLIGRKIGEEEKRKKNIPSVQWDGHTGRYIEL